MTDWSVAEVVTLRQQTLEALRTALLDEVFAPGEQLVERTLADRMNVSRTSVREALGQLEAEGLVTREPGRGVFVARLTETEVRQIYEARAVLESAMAMLFAERADAATIDALEAAIAAAEATNSDSEARVHAQKLDAASDIIMEGADNAVLRQMASVLRARVTYLRTITARVAPPERRVETMARLRAILEALRARDGTHAATLIRAYIERSAAYAIEVLRRANANP